MHTHQTIMVLFSNHAWTLGALHCACVLAQNTSANITLVQMIPVQHLAWNRTGIYEF